MRDEQRVTDVAARYATAAKSLSSTGVNPLLGADDVGRYGSTLYSEGIDDAPEAAVTASLGCGNPLAVVDLRPGETVLDLGSGGGLDVILSGRRVGPTGRAIGLDMTEEMLELARQNAAEAGVTNVEFVKGRIEQIPLPDASVDVVISNCVITLSTDKSAVLREVARVLVDGGRLGVSDVIAGGTMTDAEREAGKSEVSCLSTSLTADQYVELLTAVGLVDVEVNITHEAGPKLHAAIIRARKG